MEKHDCRKNGQVVWTQSQHVVNSVRNYYLVGSIVVRMPVTLKIVHLAWFKLCRNAGVDQLLEMWNATRLPAQRTYSHVKSLAGGRRIVEGIGAVRDAALYQAPAIVVIQEIGIHTSA